MTQRDMWLGLLTNNAHEDMAVGVWPTKDDALREARAYVKRRQPPVPADFYAVAEPITVHLPDTTP